MEYALVSTSYTNHETVVYKADEEGKILDYNPLAKIDHRFNLENWANKSLAVAKVGGQWEMVKHLGTHERISQALYKRK